MKTAEPKSTATPSLLQRKSSEGSAPFFQKEGGERSAFFSENSGAAVDGPFFQSNARSAVQPKLKIGAVDDPLERQADAAADRAVDRIVSKPSAVGQASGAPAVQAKCDHCEKEEKLQKKEEEGGKTEEKVQMKPIFDSGAEGPPDEGTIHRKEAAGGGEASASDGFSSKLGQSKGGGQPLPEQTRSDMEGAMGADFSGVRVHSGSEAAGMSSDIGAQAFTHGSDIYFNEGKYDTGSRDGQRLLAHELAHTVQQGGAGERIDRKPKDHAHASDGKNVKNRATAKIESEVDGNVDFNKKPSQMSAEDRQKARDVDSSKKKQSRGSMKAAKTAEPDVNRPKETAPKAKAAKESGKKKLNDKPAKKGGAGQKAAGKASQLGKSDAKEAAAKSAMAQAAQMKMPARPPELIAPKMGKPKDSKGEELPSRPDLDKAIVGLHEIAKLFVENAFDLKKEAVNDQQEGLKMRGTLDQSFAKTERTKAGSEKMKDHLQAREDINAQEEKALEKVEGDTAMVKKEAPRLMAEADKGREEAGPMVKESQATKQEMDAKQPEDEEAATEAAEQSGQTSQVADDSQKGDDTLNQTGQRAAQYAAEAAAGEQKNQQTRGRVTENKATAQKTTTEIARIDKHTAKAEAQLQALNGYPKLVEQQTTKRAASGEELYAAGMKMNDELNAIQEEYHASMSALPSKEAAAEEQKKQQTSAPAEEAPEKQLTPEQESLVAISNLPEEQMEAVLMSKDEAELSKLETSLQGMETHEEAEAKEGSLQSKPDAEGRTKTDLGKLFESKDKDQPPPDPRQEQIDGIENKRAERVGGVKQVADANFTFLSVEQKMMLAQKLAMKDAVSGLFDISIMDMGKSMILGMINPAESLKGVLDGASKLATGVVNLFNAEAWRKDPLGNLLQSAADIATGLTMIFMSITGIATAITIIMAAITIASLGFASPITVPVMSFMATIITTVGGWTIVTGLIALALNALTYIKNLHDAGVAKNTDELLSESDQIKQNMTDGFTSAMAVVGAKGDKAGAAAMKKKIAGAGSAKAFGKQMVGELKDGVTKTAGKVGNFALKGAKAVQKFTAAGLKKIGSGIKKAIQKLRSGLDEGLAGIKGGSKKLWDDLKEGLGGKKKGGHIDTPNVKRLGHEGGVKVMDEFPAPGGHTYKVLENGAIVICSTCTSIKLRYGPELKDKGLAARLKKIEAQMKDATPAKRKKLIKQQEQLEAELLDKKAARVHGEYVDTVGPKGKLTPDDIKKRLAKGEEFDPITKRFSDTPAHTMATLKMPKTGGKWIGERGSGKWFSELDEVKKVTKGRGIAFKDGYPDFSPFAEGKFVFKGLDGTAKDFKKVYERLMKEHGFDNPSQAKKWLSEEGLTPHHHQDGRTILLIPTALHRNVRHSGGASMLRLINLTQ